MVAAIGQVYNFITTDMAWLYLLIGFGMAVGAIVLLTTKFGDIRLGDGMQSRIIKHFYLDRYEPLLRVGSRYPDLWHV